MPNELTVVHGWTLIPHNEYFKKHRQINSVEHLSSPVLFPCLVQDICDGRGESFYQFLYPDQVRDMAAALGVAPEVSTEEILAQIIAKRDQALQVVYKLAKDPDKFSMSVPVQRERDDDCVLADAIEAVNPLLAIVDNLRQSLAIYRNAMLKIAMGGSDGTYADTSEGHCIAECGFGWSNFSHSPDCAYELAVAQLRADGLLPKE